MKLKLIVIFLWLFMGISHATIRVTWPPVDHPDLAGYVVFRAVSTPPVDYIQISSETELITETFFMDEGAVGYFAFWYFIIAVNPAGDLIEQSIPECIIHYCHGDANLSGIVEISDAVLIERHVVGLVNLEDNIHAFRAADANLDGWVDIADAVLVKRFIVELDTQEAHCLVAK